MRVFHWVILQSVLACACVGAVGGDLDGNAAGAGSANAASNPAGDPAIAAACSPNYAPGHVPIHRLTNAEYDNTVRDLLFVDAHPAQGFAPAAPGLSGFRNDSDALKISDDVVNAYYDAAEAVAKDVLATKGQAGGAYAKLVTCAPSAQCALQTVKALGARAYRRPLTDAETTALMAVFNAAGDFDTGLSDAMVAMLISPKFLFVAITSDASNKDGVPFALDDYALASRLSYALWQSMPDDELLGLAAKGQLHDPDTLRAQVARMVKDARIVGFLKSMRDDWAGLEALADPAGKLNGLDDGLRASMVAEVDAYIKDVVTQNKSILELVSGRATFADAKLSQYYGLPFTGADPNVPQRVTLPPNRRGIVTSAAVMTATSGATTFTHPVKRGKWVTHQILCSAPPPPPAGIPQVDFSPSDGDTPRQKLDKHVQGGCIGCHKQMDAIGLGLENYDPFGRWRDKYADLPASIDASGALDNGKTFSGPSDMVDLIAQDAATRACLAQQVMAYAMTRAMTSSDDRCVSNAIGQTAVTETSTFTDLLAKIVNSRQFLMQTGEAP